MRPSLLPLWLAALTLPGLALARDRDHDRVPDHDDACPDEPGDAASLGCPQVAAPAPPPTPAGPTVDLTLYPEPASTLGIEGPVDPTGRGSCEGGVLQAEGEGKPPAPGAWWTFTFSCRVGAWLRFKGPTDAPLPPELVVGATGRLTWDSTAHMLWFDVKDGAGGLRRVSPMPAVAQPPATPTPATRPPGTYNLSCPGVFGGLSGGTLTFTCDGEAARDHRIPKDRYLPEGMPAPGTRATLRFVEIRQTTTSWTEWSAIEVGGKELKPESLYEQLLRESGEQ